MPSGEGPVDTARTDVPDPGYRHRGLDPTASRGRAREHPRGRANPDSHRGALPLAAHRPPTAAPPRAPALEDHGGRGRSLPRGESSGGAAERGRDQQDADPARPDPRRGRGARPGHPQSARASASSCEPASRSASICSALSSQTARGLGALSLRRRGRAGETQHQAGIQRSRRAGNHNLEAAGLTPLPDGLTPHKARHTFTSLLVALGRDPVDVMAQLGHTDPALSPASTAMRCAEGMLRGRPYEPLWRALIWARMGTNDPLWSGA